MEARRADEGAQQKGDFVWCCNLGKAPDVYRRRRGVTTAPYVSGLQQIFRVIHPFHPLYKQEFTLVQYRRSWGAAYLDYQDKAGKHGQTRLYSDFVHKLLEDDEAMDLREVTQRIKKHFAVLVHPRSIKRALMSKKKQGSGT